MTAGVIGLVVSACVFFGGMVGLLLNRILPEHHLTKETTDAVRLGTGMLSVLAALVLGLLIATARDSLDAADRIVRDVSTSLISLDQTFDAYGLEVAHIRTLLHRYAQTISTDGWSRPQHDVRGASGTSGVMLEQVRRAVLALEPGNTEQRWLREQALVDTGSLMKARWELLERQDLPIRPAFLVFLTSWIGFIFMSFGLNAPRNPVVIGTLAVCSYAIGASVFLILEMEAPFDGIIQVAKEPMKVALDRIEQ